MVAIDGCEIGCAKAILDHAEVPVKGYLVLTDLGIDKNKNFSLKDLDIQKVKNAVRNCCKGDEKQGEAGNADPGACCG